MSSNDTLSQIPDHRIPPTSIAATETSTLFQLEWRRALFEWASHQVRNEVRDVTWRAFQQTAIAGRSPEVVATELGITTGSVYTAKCRVTARIRERVDRWRDYDQTLPDSPAAD
ncbi:MAG: hypothetical protein R3C03_12415 [Pirellulaceae bacterium]